MGKRRIAIIGVGNMGGAIMKGLLKSGFISASDLIISDQNESMLEELKGIGVHIAENNKDATQKGDAIIVAVKPWQLTGVLQEIKSALDSSKILISIAAGKELKELSGLCGPDIPVFRVIPNTAVSVQESLTCISAGESTGHIKKYVIDLFDHLGKTVEIPEDLMSAATVTASCGIAYALRYIRAAMQGGIETGLNADMAGFIAAQTVKGAAELILYSGSHPEKEIDKVTTPGGITISGLNEMEYNGFSASVIKGIMASFRKMEK
jgi:pyrroline-5-carboxylate reductase